MRAIAVLSIQLIFLMIGSTASRKPEDPIDNNNDGILLRRVAQMINKGRRSNDPRRGMKRHKAIRQLNPEIVEKAEDVDLHGAQAQLIETELISALAHKKSALLDKPFVETKGRNDFLVIHPAFRDPFVTVIPNMIYYNIEKKCVNWLDDCNLHGMKARLLREVQSPYKK